MALPEERIKSVHGFPPAVHETIYESRSDEELDHVMAMVVVARRHPCDENEAVHALIASDTDGAAVSVNTIRDEDEEVLPLLSVA